jgi:hypothetical protein
MTTKPRSTQELPISHKTRKLNQKTENMILTTIAHGGPSKRSLQQNSSVHSASVPAKKRRRTIIKSISIKPSDYVQSAFKANGFAIDAIKKDAEAMFSIPTQEMIEAYKPEILDAVRKNDLQKVLCILLADEDTPILFAIFSMKSKSTSICGTTTTALLFTMLVGQLLPSSIWSSCS